MRRCAFVVALACGHADVAEPDAGDAATKPADVHVLAMAEDQRNTAGVVLDLRHDPNPHVRAAAARALARIADTRAQEGLLAMLKDDDAETVAWSAYGLGFACKGREEPHVRALSARALGLRDDKAFPDPHAAIARAIGRCGGGAAETTLAAWIKAKGPFADDSEIALGDLAARRGRLDDDTVTVLLDAAEKGHARAFYPFARMEKLDPAFAPRLHEAALAAIKLAPSDERVFAVRALAKVGVDAAPELARIAADGSALPAERADAARSLGKLGDAGHASAAGALAQVLPAHADDPLEVLRLAGDDYAIALALVGSVGDHPTAALQPILRSASVLRAPSAPESLARRLATLRCTAASSLASGAFDSEVLRTCDAPATVAFERGRLSSLVRRPLVGDRKTAWISLTASNNVTIVEAALEAIDGHPELGDAARTALTTALGDARAGVVATAAERIHAHPERWLVLSAKERKAALDPKAPPPTTHPAQEVDPLVSKALAVALAKPWSESLIETRVALLEAAVALKLGEAQKWVDAACIDPNTTMRDHAMKARRALGDAKPACPPPATMPLAAEANAPHGGKLTLETDAGTLSITFDPVLAPVASTRLLDLARAGFFKGIVVHRVVPGFVVQFGDPGSDGYSGAEKSLRCETSPVPFGPLDVGVALAGRDTGSSQIFVTLARFPHLEGDYARVGHAEGDWGAVAEGDVIHDARVDDGIVAAGP